MSKVISVNAGSSSLKFQLFNMPEEEVLTSGVAERIGLDEGIFTIKVNGEKHTQNLPIKDHKVAVELLLEALVKYHIVETLRFPPPATASFRAARTSISPSRSMRTSSIKLRNWRRWRRCTIRRI